MRKAWLSLALGLALTTALAASASACQWHNTSASNDAAPPAQTAAAAQTSNQTDN